MTRTESRCIGCYTPPTPASDHKTLDNLIAAAGRSAKAIHGLKMIRWTIDLCGVDLTDKLISQIVEGAQTEAIFDLNLSNTPIPGEQLAELDAGSVLQKTVSLKTPAPFKVQPKVDN